MAIKGQGLPISFIVIAAISALVLVLVVAFTIGGLGDLFRGIFQTGGLGDELSLVQTACRTSCTTSQTTSIDLESFQSSRYCREVYSVDIDNKDGLTDNEKGLHCWDSQQGSINVGCDAQVNGQVFTEENCPEFAAGGGGGF